MRVLMRICVAANFLKKSQPKIPKMAITWLQLLVFYAKLLGRTQQRFDIMGTNLETVYDSRDQKKLEIGLA